ncbi:MAG: hypothetical protein JRS35_24960, partial [Deltaproteobacteria bacterium]|nr:hypothetical protein [Deltaproteobacteria bacterium]
MFHPPEHTALALCEISPTREPVGAFEALRGRAYPWLLDSALPSPRLGRFSFAGADPYLLLRARGGSIELECRRAVHAGLTPGRHVVDGDFFETARALLPRLPAQAGASELPFVGGALCALGYELAEQIEDLALGGRLDDLALPDATILFVDRVLVWDHHHERLFAAALGFGAQAAAAHDAAEQGARALGRWLAG